MLCRDPDILEQNRARLRFYERYDARPIAGTAYETPVTDPVTWAIDTAADAGQVPKRPSDTATWMLRMP